jgi:hypothetical protein
MTKVGSRVGAILSTDKDTVNFIGYGVYVGDEVPDKDAAGFCEGLREHGLVNPKIVLDDGTVVWGGECWWGPEEQIKKKMVGMKVVQVDMKKERKKG